MAANEISVAGIRIHTKQFNKSRGRSYFCGMNISEIKSQIEASHGKEQLTNATPISGFPDDSLLRSIKWSPDSKFLSCLVVVEDQIELWVIDILSAKARKVTSSINASLAVTSHSWNSNSREIFVMKAINKEKEIPNPPIPPFSPSIRSNLCG